MPRYGMEVVLGPPSGDGHSSCTEHSPQTSYSQQSTTAGAALRLAAAPSGASCGSSQRDVGAAGRSAATRSGDRASAGAAATPRCVPAPSWVDKGSTEQAMSGPAGMLTGGTRTVYGPPAPHPLDNICGHFADRPPSPQGRDFHIGRSAWCHPRGAPVCRCIVTFLGWPPRRYRRLREHPRAACSAQASEHWHPPARTTSSAAFERPDTSRLERQSRTPGPPRRR